MKVFDNFQSFFDKINPFAFYTDYKSGKIDYTASRIFWFFKLKPYKGTFQESAEFLQEIW